MNESGRTDVEAGQSVPQQLGKFSLHGQVAAPSEKYETRKEGYTDVKHAIDIMHVSMLPSSIMDVVLWHCDLKSVEHSGLRSSVSPR